MTDHDPMLDGITRWDLFVSTKLDVLPVMAVDGEYVLFSDLPALLAAVREDERGKQRSEWVKDSLPRKYGIDSGWIVSETTACTCGMGRGSAYGHEAFCGLEQEAPVEEFDGWVKFILKAASEQGQREGWQAGFDYAWPRGMQAQRDEVTYAETDDAYEQGQRDALATQTSATEPGIAPPSPGNAVVPSVAPAGEDYGALMYQRGRDDEMEEQRDIRREEKRISYMEGYEQGQRDEREACIAAVSAPTLHDDACCSNGCTLMHSSQWEAIRRIQIALGFPLSEEPPPPYRCDGSCNCTAAAFIAAIRAREEKPNG